MIKQQTVARVGDEILDVDLGYRKDYPLEVRFRFYDEDGSVEWMMARDLLANGMMRKQGEGDVVIDPADDGVVSVTLRVLSEQMEIVFSSDDLYKFLVATYTEVAEGEELPTVLNSIDQFISDTLKESS